MSRARTAVNGRITPQKHAAANTEAFGVLWKQYVRHEETLRRIGAEFLVNEGRATDFFPANDFDLRVVAYDERVRLGES